jgi:hypothetical protein
MEITPFQFGGLNTTILYRSDFQSYKFLASTGLAGGFLFRASRPQLPKGLTIWTPDIHQASNFI